MNQQQRTLLVIFVAVVLVLVVAIIGVNLSRRNAMPDVLTATAAPEPTLELPELQGKTEEEIGAMAIGEEESDRFISAFDEDVVLDDITPDPNATPEPID